MELIKAKSEKIKSSLTIKILAEGKQATHKPANSSRTIDFWSLSDWINLEVAWWQTKIEKIIIITVIKNTVIKFKAK